MQKLVTFLMIVVLIAISASHSFAQKKISFDKEGKATINTTVKADSKVIYAVSGKDFNNIQIKQTAGSNLKYEIKRGNEFLSSGHTTGSNITFSSDGESKYSLIVMNTENKVRVLSLSIMELSK